MSTVALFEAWLSCVLNENELLMSSTVHLNQYVSSPSPPPPLKALNFYRTKIIFFNEFSTLTLIELAVRSWLKLFTHHSKTNDLSEAPYNQSRLTLSIRLLPCCHIVIMVLMNIFPFFSFIELLPTYHRTLVQQEAIFIQV